MYCSGCGQQLEPGQTNCPKCGRPITPLASPAVPMGVSSVPGFGFELESYRSKVKALAIVWFVWAGLGLLMGFAALTFARAFFMGGFGHWMNGAPPPPFVFPGIISFIWAMLVVRAALAALAGWGLLQQEQWGRIVAIIAAILSLLKFPFGTVLGIWTLVMLLGYRNSTLYEQL
jgi:hypothetical protein